MEQRDNQQTDDQQARGHDRQKQDQDSDISTSAQRSGGQSQDGKGMGDEPFKGSSLSGQSSDSSTDQQQDGGTFAGQGHDRSSDKLSDPTTSQADQPYVPEGPDAEQQASRLSQTERGEQRENSLDGE